MTTMALALDRNLLLAYYRSVDLLKMSLFIEGQWRSQRGVHGRMFPPSRTSGKLCMHVFTFNLGPMPGPQWQAKPLDSPSLGLGYEHYWRREQGEKNHL